MQPAAFSAEPASKRSVQHLWMMQCDCHVLSFLSKKFEWREVWRARYHARVSDREGYTDIALICLGLLFSFMLLPTTDESLQSLWMKSSSSWKERTAEKTVQTPRSLSLQYCVGVSTFFFFFSVLQHFPDQKLLLLLSFKKLKPPWFSLSCPFSSWYLHFWPMAVSWCRFRRPALTSMQKLNFCSQFSPHSH